MSEVVSSTNLVMDAETLEALKGSIAKWQAIVDGTGENKGPYNCPLCQRFNSAIKNGLPIIFVSCDGCPVKAATGFDGCMGTPYDAYEEAQEADELDELEMRDLACDELNFLKSLLPKEAP